MNLSLTYYIWQFLRSDIQGIVFTSLNHTVQPQQLSQPDPLLVLFQALILILSPNKTNRMGCLSTGSYGVNHGSFCFFQRLSPPSGFSSFQLQRSTFSVAKHRILCVSPRWLGFLSLGAGHQLPSCWSLALPVLTANLIRTQLFKAESQANLFPRSCILSRSWIKRLRNPTYFSLGLSSPHWIF